MTTLSLPDELAERVRLAATAHGMTPEQLIERFTVEGLERLRLQEHLERLVGDRERSSATGAGAERRRFRLRSALEQLGTVLERTAHGEGRYDIELTGR